MNGSGGLLKRQQSWWRRPETAVVAVLVTIVYAVYSWRVYLDHAPPSWDLAIFTQAVRAYSEFRAPIAPIKGLDYNLLGDHFHPWLALIAPVYRLAPSPITLLVVQAALFGASTIPVTRLAGDLWSRWIGVLVGLAYGFSWGLVEAVAAEFHEIALGVPLLAFSLEALVRRRPTAAVAWALPLLLVKEDLGLTVAAVGFVLLLRGWYRPGWTALLGGLGGFLLTVLVLLPALNPDHQWDYGARLGGRGDGQLQQSPGLLATALQAWPTKAHTVLLLVLIAGILGLLSPIALLAVPTLAWRFLGDVPYYWGSGFHYSAVLMPVAIMALLDAVVRLRRPQAGSLSARRTLRHTVAGAAWLVPVATAIWMLPGSSLAGLGSARLWDRDEHAAAVVAAADLVPSGAMVESDVPGLAILAPRATVMWVANGNPAPDYLMLDSYAGGWGDAFPTDLVGYAESLHPGASYVQIFDQAGVHLLREATAG